MGKHRNTRKPLGDYAVGYRRPPATKRFQKGRSGNPSGRPRGVKSLGQVLAEGMERRVTVQENGKPRRMRMRDVIVQGLINDAARRDFKAIGLLFRLMDHYGAGQAKDVELATLAADDAAIIRAFRESLREIPDPGDGDPTPADPAQTEDESTEEN